MGLSKDLVGKKSDASKHTYTHRDAILYGLGIGAREDELDFLFEGRGPRVYPTFAVVPSFTALLQVSSQLGVPPTMIVHGEQHTRLHRLIPPSGTLVTVAEIKAVADKGPGKLGVVYVEARTTDEQGEPVFDNHFTIVCRGAGGFGGDPGPETRSFDPPAGKAPDFEVTEATTREQALLYRLSGDWNPLHADPGFAKMGGFARPILHGLCTFGFAGRALLKAAAGSDPQRVKAFGARFAKPVMPGDTLTTRGWQVEPGRYVLTVSQQDGVVVLSNGTAEIG